MVEDDASDIPVKDTDKAEQDVYMTSDSEGGFSADDPMVGDDASLDPDGVRTQQTLGE